MWYALWRTGYESEVLNFEGLLGKTRTYLGSF